MESRDFERLDFYSLYGGLFYLGILLSIVFFLPLAGAGIHLAFAFPIVEKLLMCFNLNNRPLFIATSVGSFLVLALFYVAVYRITAGAYYRIVSGADRGEG